MEYIIRRVILYHRRRRRKRERSEWKWKEAGGETVTK